MRLSLTFTHCDKLLSKRKLNLKFKDLQYKQFINNETLAIDINKMIRDVLLNTNPKPSLTENELEDEIKNIIRQDNNTFEICCGKDLISILLIGLQNFGKPTYRETCLNVIKGVLISYYDFSYFQLTELCKSISNWEKNNTPFKVLKEI